MRRRGGLSGAPRKTSSLLVLLIHHKKPMPILGALGLLLTILVLQGMVPKIFHEIEATILALLHGAQISIEAATQLAAIAGTLAP
ncbi:MAG: hypothetical protein WBK28_03475 [Minisyncoccia bacterium]